MVVIKKLLSAFLVLLLIVQPSVTFADTTPLESEAQQLLPVSDPEEHEAMQQMVDTRNTLEDISQFQTQTSQNPEGVIRTQPDNGSESQVIAESLDPVQSVNQTAGILETSFDINADGVVDAEDLRQIQGAFDYYNSNRYQAGFSDATKRIFGDSPFQTGYVGAVLRDLAVLLDTGKSITEKENVANAIFDSYYENTPPAFQNVVAPVLVNQTIDLIQMNYPNSDFHQQDLLTRLVKLINHHPQESFYSKVTDFLTETVLSISQGETASQFERRKAAVLALWDQHHVLIFYPPDAFEPQTGFNVYDSHLNMLDKITQIYASDYPPYREAISVIVFTKDVWQICGSPACPMIFGQGDYLASVFIHESAHQIQNSEPVVLEAVTNRFVRLFNESLESGDFISSYHAFAEEDFAELVANWAIDSKELLRRGLARSLTGNAVLLEKLLFWDSLNPDKNSSELAVYFLSSQTEPVPLLKDSIKIARDAQSRIISIYLDGQIYSIQYTADGRINEVTSLAEQEEVSPVVQTYIQELQGQLGSNFTVSARPGPVDPTKSIITVSRIGEASPGTLVSVTYRVQTASDGSVIALSFDTLEIAPSPAGEVLHEGDVDGTYLYQGLLQLPGGVDPVTALSRAVFLPIGDREGVRAYFELDGSYWIVSREIVNGERQTVLTLETPEVARTYYLESLQQAFSDIYDVSLRVSNTDPSKFTVTVKLKRGVSPVQGKISELTYTAQLTADHGIALLRESLRVHVPGTDPNGPALAEGLTRLGFTDVIGALSRVFFHSVTSKEYYFEIDGRYFSVRVKRQGQNTVVVSAAPAPHPFVHDYVRDLDARIGSNYTVSVELSPENPDEFTIRIVANGSVSEGKLKSLSYRIHSAPGQGEIDVMTGTIQTVFRGTTSGAPDITDMNGDFLFQGLDFLPAANPFSVLDNIVIKSAGPDQIEFMLANKSYRIIRSSAGEIVLQVKQFLGRSGQFTWVIVRN